MADAKILDEDHLVRSVPFARLRKADGSDDEIIGVLPQAFALRPDEDYLSATWLEFFSGSTPAAQKVTMVRTLRASKFKPTAKSGFAIGKVQEIRMTCANAGHQVRVIHDPTEDNPGHAAVRRYPSDDIELFTALASGAWSEWFLNRDIP